ncbi:pollen-specific leucine-rich repeat extensin-like protein 4 [Iris pallida]|uniref:Pollen-specific leucine-rich repeat extensin-like protein 4 n=1 Tax=Iris pallida TaxID=29817 RepID=A0AAX6DVR5_IRIPA|nr:pollen-specific leucine-rich repeat extensin-like protein 4 [Iris pallida]KAJ6795937.1 pollen-specific leucine-rich repeat extensin-like protein 4 [Iris pallida]
MRVLARCRGFDRAGRDGAATSVVATRSTGLVVRSSAGGTRPEAGVHHGRVLDRKLVAAAFAVDDAQQVGETEKLGGQAESRRCGRWLVSGGGAATVERLDLVRPTPRVSRERG